jgi:hypothetical protein
MIEFAAKCLATSSTHAEQQKVVLIAAATPHEAERLIESGEPVILKVQKFPSITFSTALLAQTPA